MPNLNKLIEKIKALFGKKQPTPPEEELPKVLNIDELNENGDIMVNMEEPEAETKTLKNKVIVGLAVLVGLFVFTSMMSSFLSGNDLKTTKKADAPINNAGEQKNSDQDDLPKSYGDIAKYAQKQEQNKQANVRPKTVAPNNNNTPVAQPLPAPQPSAVQRSIANENKKSELEAMKKNIASALSFIIKDSSEKNGSKTAQGGIVGEPETHTQGISSYNLGAGSFNLQAGAVIQATLLTGVTSDSPSGDVVAQVRQNIYDSLTGEHLLIPQGSKLIGTSGTAGNRGNKRLGVIFTRIIYPNGTSIALPSQKAIDGVGFPGLSGKYDDHNSSLYRTAFMGAVLSAVSQSATGNSSGTDTRSPGQEAVAGGVASILDTAKTLVERDANMQPTITINPGTQFSVFINKDLNLGEYFG